MKGHDAMISLLDPTVIEAYRVLETGEPLAYGNACRLAKLSGEAVLDLLSLANKVRNRYAPLPEGDRMHRCSILNAKSGVCGENCSFCAQSLHNRADVEQYQLLDEQSVFDAAERVYREGVRHFGIVTSGYGYRRPNAEFYRIIELIGALRNRYEGLNVCASIGVLGEETARMLAEAGTAHYNINIQVSPSRYGKLIADSHTVEERIETVRLLRKHGVPVCCGGILGVGESMQERVDLVYALQELDVAVIPLNVLVPVKGTLQEGAIPVPVSDVLKTFAICRLAHPSKVIKFAAGRETVMKDFQGLLMLAGVNGFLTGGYLTTRGREIPDDMRLAAELGGFGRQV